MLFSSRSRPSAWPLSLAMAATFPGVFLFQIVTLPAVLTVQTGTYLFWRLLEPSMPDTTHNFLVYVAFILSGMLTFGLMLAMSIVGFCEGWLVGWGCAKGQKLREIIKRGPTAHILGLAARRLRA
jgi:predicted lysophospholipase L1 biosynthesis ABC-type transport system permease subunit